MLALRRYPHRLMLACGAVLSLLSISVLVTLIVVQVNAYEARRIAEFRRAHNALQLQLHRQDASYMRLANMAEYAWDQNMHFGNVSADAMRRAYLQGGQRLIVVADEKSRPQMALGLATEKWRAEDLQRYLQLSAAVSLIQRLAGADGNEGLASASYFFDPNGQYLSLDQGLTERGLTSALATSTRSQLFEHLRVPANLLAPASSHDLVPALESVERSDRPRRTFGRHPITGEDSLIAVFQVSEGVRPVATFVAYEPMARLQALLRGNSQGRISLLDRDGRNILSAGEAHSRYPSQRIDTDWVLLGDATRARYHNGRFNLALAVSGTPWTLVETYRWNDILQGITPMLVPGTAVLLGTLVLLWCLLLWLHRRMCMPALNQVLATYARERCLQQVLERLPVGVGLLDQDSGMVQALNGTLQLMDAATGSRLFPHLRERVAGAHAGALVIADNLPRADDSRRPLFHRTFIHAACDHWPGRTLLLVEDRSDDACAMREHQARTEDAEARSRAKSNFVAAMSHEIRTPLNGIVGHLELMSRAPLQAEQQERLLRIRQSADSLLEIITDVLDLSRIESEQWTLVPESFGPAAMLERVALLFAPIAQAKGLELDCVVDENVPEMATAPMGAVERVLRNLASNALKFTDSGRVLLRVSCRGEGARRWLRFEVVDSGIGLCPQQRDRLFQPFVQADASILARFGGSGLGLALCQQLCERMGGSIRVESTLGVGSRFLFEVPSSFVSDAASVPPALAGRQVGLLATSGPWRAELRQRMRRWGMQVQLLDCAAGDSLDELGDGAVIVLFEPRADEMEAVVRSGRVWIQVRREGPLRPEWRQGGGVVSCYASQALYQALRHGDGSAERG
ncbi:sensor histidine kinase [[Pseudomonas] boreopolis]|uniref:sensor histidine kinase n=1 Tax=Xanthomonas boreopolis TaxID=86183 RepID=UPI003DA027F7